MNGYTHVFPPFLQRETSFASLDKKPFKNKELLLKNRIFFYVNTMLIPSEKGSNRNGILASPESVTVHLHTTKNMELNGLRKKIVLEKFKFLLKEL